MNQPSEDRIKRLEEEQRQLKEEVRKLKEQMTEPIKIDRLEIDRGGTQELLKEANKKLERIIQTQTDRSEKFDRLEHGQRDLKGELESISRRQNEYDKGLISHSRNISALQTEMAGARADILKIRESQLDLRDTIKEHGERLGRIEASQAVQIEMMREILARLPEPEAE